MVDQILHLFGADGTFLERTHQTGGQLSPIKRDPASILFYHPGKIEFSRFVGSESLSTEGALAASAHLVALAEQSGIDYLGIGGTAERASHVYMV